MHQRSSLCTLLGTRDSAMPVHFCTCVDKVPIVSVALQAGYGGAPKRKKKKLPLWSISCALRELEESWPCLTQWANRFSRLEHFWLTGRTTPTDSKKTMVKQNSRARKTCIQLGLPKDRQHLQYLQGATCVVGKRCNRFVAVKISEYVITPHW